MNRLKTIGMLGGGQLGRMSALAGAPLGIRTHVYAPESDSPAAQVTDLFTNAGYDDHTALKKFAEQVDTITYEFENVPVECVRYLESLGKKVYPSSKVLEIAQERLKEKTAMNDYGLPTTRFAPAKSPEDIQTVMKEWGASASIIKTIRFGYDGKGQTKVTGMEDAARAFADLKADIVIVEEIVDFNHEISVIVARDVHGNVGSYDPGLNVHKNSILHTTTVPAPVDSKILTAAKNAAHALAEKIDLVGVLGVEMFVTRSGQILINEIAPRPHNSGHWTMDACFVSQFEQQMRAVAGLPLGSFERHHDAVMTNLLGDDINTIPDLIKNEKAHVHDYGKREPKEGRKMGHVTIIS